MLGWLLLNVLGDCPEILYTNVSDKMTYADSVKFDQTAPKEAM